MVSIWIGLLFLGYDSRAITNNFPCEKLDKGKCEDIGYCYWDGRSCKKDTCLGIAISNASIDNGCADDCNVATLENHGYGDECSENPFLFICTKRNSRYIENCFAGFVLSKGVCSIDTWGDVGYCKNLTETFEDSDGNEFTGQYCAENSDFECSILGVTNCNLFWWCKIDNGICVYDACFEYSNTSECNSANGCKNYTRYAYDSDVRQNTVEIVCGKSSEKYGKDPDPCVGIPAFDYPDESPCSKWFPGQSLPDSTPECKVIENNECGVISCVADCRVLEPRVCTSASGIPGVSCVAKTITSENYTFYTCERE